MRRFLLFFAVFFFAVFFAFFFIAIAVCYFIFLLIGLPTTPIFFPECDHTFIF